MTRAFGIGQQRMGGEELETSESTLLRGFVAKGAKKWWLGAVVIKKKENFFKMGEMMAGFTPCFLLSFAL